jgi:hypothetical protein
MNVSGKPIEGAPDRLIRAYQKNEMRAGRVILGRLLTDDRMLTVWTELSRYVKDDRQWLLIWRAIANAKSMSNKESRLRKSRGDERDDYVKLAGKFEALAKKIKKGPLDVLAYELLPQDVLAALNVTNFDEMDVLQRSNVAHQLLRCWPSAPELLRGLATLSVTLSKEAMTKPRADERSRGDVAARIFVRHLGCEFHSMFGRKMLGTLAKIADTTLNRKEELSRSFVQSALRGV